MIATLTSTERHHTCPEEAGVEGHVDTRKGDRCEATLELDVSLTNLLLLGLVERRGHDLTEHLLYLVDGEFLRQLARTLAIS